MRSRLLARGVLAAGCLLVRAAAQEPLSEVVPNPPGVRLELTMEIATTTEGGLPAALRFTLANIGSVAVDIPDPSIDCAGSTAGDVRIETVIHFDGKPGNSFGRGCGGGIGSNGHPVPFAEQVRQTWFHLRPGEYLVFTGDRRRMIDKAGAPATYEYHAVYDPPPVTQDQRRLAAQAGYIIPSEPVQSDTLEYHED